VSERNIIFSRDLKRRKGITWSRQHVNRKIKNGTFPPPDGRVNPENPNSPPWWYETTLDGYTDALAAATKKNDEGPGPTQGARPSFLTNHQPAARRAPKDAASDEPKE
jgi:hypothetical protein